MKTISTLILTTCFLLFLIIESSGQSDTIFWKNPSFEGIPRTSLLPKGWFNCNATTLLSPDIQPNGAFQMQKQALEGDTYLGMVTRENNTKASVGQQLNQPLQQGQCYFFTISLCRTNHYKSLHATTEHIEQDDGPVKLTIWAGNEACQRKEKLAETNAVYNKNWLDFVLTFQPSNNYEFILFEANYEEDLSIPYNGHLLMDRATPIIAIPCDSLKRWEGAGNQVLLSQLRGKETLILHDETFWDKPQPLKAIYYNKAMTSEARALALNHIQSFTTKFPYQKANIIIEETTKKVGKQQKKQLENQLNELGIGANHYTISIFKK